ncbi:hypothetical protein ACP6PL_28225 [Dapis sp. BLCC M126]|uniref:hypothetical protein n=1 Tax=Dapis sp. BLCC M126 TaxID=3400189 RepID=UPI003CE724E7
MKFPKSLLNLHKTTDVFVVFYVNFLIFGFALCHGVAIAPVDPIDKSRALYILLGDRT